MLSLITIYIRYYGRLTHDLTIESLELSGAPLIRQATTPLCVRNARNCIVFNIIGYAYSRNGSQGLPMRATPRDSICFNLVVYSTAQGADNRDKPAAYRG